jgi:HPt (histidine-containing phosphotransfer) domain-containing protein
MLRLLDPGAGGTLMIEVAQDFSVDVPSGLALLRMALASHDADGVLRQLRAIAGCAAAVGATRVEHLARSLEQVPQHDAAAILAGAAALIDRLEGEFVRARVALDSVGAQATVETPGPSASEMRPAPTR